MLYTWTQTGYVSPAGGFQAVVLNGGPGHKFQYEPAVLPVLQRMVALTRNGFSPRSAAALAHAAGGVLAVADTGYTVTLTDPS
jgi:hypothetical protein